MKELILDDVIIRNTTDPDDPTQVSYEVYSVIRSNRMSDGAVLKSTNALLGTIYSANDEDQSGNTFLKTSGSVITAPEMKGIQMFMDFIHL